MDYPGERPYALRRLDSNARGPFECQCTAIRSSRDRRGTQPPRLSIPPL